MTRAQQIIIDGYNVIYTDNDLRRIACTNLEAARKELIVLLGRYLESRDLLATLVFDGRGGITESEVVIPGKLQVLFSSRGQTADDVIVKTVLESGAPRRYLVVTSDQADIGSRLRPAGSQLMGSKRFLDRVTRRRRGKKSVAGTEEEAPPNLGDTDYWLKQFEGDGDGGE